MKAIVQLAVATSLAGVVFIIGSISAADAECLTTLPEVRHEHWSYRLIKGQQCWHPDRGSAPARDAASAPKKRSEQTSDKQASEKKTSGKADERAAGNPAPTGKAMAQEEVSQDRVSQDKVVQALPKADALSTAPAFTEQPPRVVPEVTTLVEVETPGTGNPNADEWFAAADAEVLWPTMRKGTLPARAIAAAKPSRLMPKELGAQDQRLAVVMLLAGIALLGGGLTLSRRERLPGTNSYLPL